MNSAIGVFDSGVGGISVLHESIQLLPKEQFLYYGDNRNAPYGPKPLSEIQSCTRTCVNHLLEYGIKALVIACNTATSAYAAELRKELSIPVIAMEPALKPASLLRHGGQILVLATNATLRLQKFQVLMEQYGEGVVPVIGHGLVELIESGLADSSRMDVQLHALLAPYLGKQIDAIVLGCTHFLFAKPALRRICPSIPLVDGNLGTARQLKRILEKENLLAPEESVGGYTLISSGGKKYTCLMERLLRSLDVQ